ncbi:MAG: hypothetical protein ACQCN6_07175 [Candidatus Bathyarchaeia archaeon]|jgi:hypothetical protein
MNRKTLALSLVLLTSLAAVMGALAMTQMFAAADTTTDSTTTSTPTTSVTTPDSSANQPQFNANMMMGEAGFGGMRCGRGHEFMDGMRGMGNIELSSEYNATINSILDSDTDVQSLISQGYSVTAIHPIIHNIIEGDGTLATKATTAIVLLDNGDSGHSIVNVDIANATVTYITTTTTTVIDKSSS